MHGILCLGMRRVKPRLAKRLTNVTESNPGALDQR